MNKVGKLNEEGASCLTGTATNAGKSSKNVLSAMGKAGNLAGCLLSNATTVMELVIYARNMVQTVK